MSLQFTCSSDSNGRTVNARKMQAGWPQGGSTYLASNLIRPQHLTADGAQSWWECAPMCTWCEVVFPFYQNRAHCAMDPLHVQQVFYSSTIEYDAVPQNHPSWSGTRFAPRISRTSQRHQSFYAPAAVFATEITCTAQEEEKGKTWHEKFGYASANLVYISWMRFKHLEPMLAEKASSISDYELFVICILPLSPTSFTGSTIYRDLISTVGAVMYQHVWFSNISWMKNQELYLYT